MYTMGDVAMASLQSEDLLYKLFGVNAELLIDHAWGWECCEISDIKAYKPSSKSLNSGQVLHCPYSFEKARLITHEMCDLLVLDMVSKGVATNQVVLTVGYDAECVENTNIGYSGEITVDHYGRQIPKHAHGSVNLGGHTSSTKKILEATLALYDRIVDPRLTVRRINISVNNLESEKESVGKDMPEQMDFFTDYSGIEERKRKEKEAYAMEKKRQNAVISIRRRFGGNSILLGVNFEDGATTIDRNKQIGGHKA